MRKTITEAKAIAAFARLTAGHARPRIWGSLNRRTWVEYDAAFALFEKWCEEHDVAAFPASDKTVLDYIEALADDGLTPSTIELRVTAIVQVHILRDVPRDRAPFRKLLRSIKKAHGAGQKQARPVQTEELRALLAHLDPSQPKDCRDGAAIAMAWGGMLRQSELVELDWLQRGDGNGAVRLEARGLLLSYCRTKTAQDALVEIKIGDADMPSARIWLERWAAAAGLQPLQPVFREVTHGGRVLRERLAPDSIARMLKRRVYQLGLAAGLDKDAAWAQAVAISGHSLRAGPITSMAIAGVPWHQIQQRSRHRNVQTLLGYIRAAQTWNDEGLRKVGI